MPRKGRKVYVVDSEPSTRNAIVKTLRAKKWVCKPYTVAEDLLDAIDSTSRGCIVVNWHQAAMSGQEMLAQLARRNVYLPVVALNGVADTRATVEAIRSGVVTVLDTRCDRRELSNAVRLALRLEDTKRRHGALLAKAKVGFGKLTAKERRVLEFIVDGVPNKRIASECDIGLRTVEARRHSIFRKMEVESLAQLVRLAVLLESSPTAWDLLHGG